MNVRKTLRNDDIALFYKDLSVRHLRYKIGMLYAGNDNRIMHVILKQPRDGPAELSPATTISAYKLDALHENGDLEWEMHPLSKVTEIVSSVERKVPTGFQTESGARSVAGD